MATQILPTTSTFPQQKLSRKTQRLIGIYTKAWEVRQQILDALNSLDCAELDDARILITELQVALHRRNELRDRISEAFSLGLHPEQLAELQVAFRAI